MCGAKQKFQDNNLSRIFATADKYGIVGRNDRPFEEGGPPCLM